MPTPTIVTRASKGTALTYDELDTNFTNLRDASGSGGAYTSNTNYVEITSAGTTTVSFTNQIVYLYVTATSGIVILDITDATNHSLQPLVLVVNKPAAGASVAIIVNGVHGVSAYNQIWDYEYGVVFYDVMANPVFDTPAANYTLVSWNRRPTEFGSWPNVPVQKYFAAGLKTEGVISSLVPANTGMIDRSDTSQSYLSGATVNFSNFSGMITVNNQTSGNVALWLCGGGAAVKLGDSLNNTSGTIAYVSGILGYRWTNSTAGTITAVFAAIKTRNSG
jgi:hypothetical protein